jgi:hypothetical protein
VITKTNMRNFVRGLLAVLTLALMLPALSQAQVDHDTQEINSYVLTDAGLTRYTKAMQAIGQIAKKNSGDCDESEDDSPKSLDQLVAAINAKPGAKSALQSAGMTPREYIVFSMSVFQTGFASWGLSQPGGKLPPGVSMANVNFYRKNEATFAKLGQATQSDDCDADNVEDDNSE